MTKFNIEYPFYFDGRTSNRQVTVDSDSEESARKMFILSHPGVTGEIKISPISLVEKAPRKWSAARKQFLKECFDYIQEKKILFEPTSLTGKQEHAEWRRANGYQFIDPGYSSLSTWTSALAEKGYIKQRLDGYWILLEKSWQE